MTRRRIERLQRLIENTTAALRRKEGGMSENRLDNPQPGYYYQCEECGECIDVGNGSQDH